MGPNRQPVFKQVLLFFVLPVIGTVAGNAVYEHLITPALPILPEVPFMLYSIFVTVFAVLFLLGLIVAMWQSFAIGWRHLTNKELRNDLVENIRRWPTSKWDLLPVIATTYFVATMLPLMASMLVLPKGRLAGVVSPEESANILLIVLTPMMVLFFIMMVRWVFESYQEMKGRWMSVTPGERLTYVSAAAFVLVTLGFVFVGDLAGWDELL